MLWLVGWLVEMENNGKERTTVTEAAAAVVAVAVAAVRSVSAESAMYVPKSRECIVLNNTTNYGTVLARVCVCVRECPTECQSPSRNELACISQSFDWSGGLTNDYRYDQQLHC